MEIQIITAGNKCPGIRKPSILQCFFLLPCIMLLMIMGKIRKYIIKIFAVSYVIKRKHVKEKSHSIHPAEF